MLYQNIIIPNFPDLICSVMVSEKINYSFFFFFNELTTDL